jgi:hypothetical protein
LAMVNTIFLFGGNCLSVLQMSSWSKLAKQSVGRKIFDRWWCDTYAFGERESIGLPKRSLLDMEDEHLATNLLRLGSEKLAIEDV